MEILFYLLFFVVSYLLGSIPTAYLIVKKSTGKDIRNEGTGNVGAMNTARATGKWYLFLLVTLIDASKGALSLLLVYLFQNFDYSISTALVITSFGVILGHCYSIYFKIKDGRFSGGKAIATLAGVLVVLDFIHLFIPGLMMLLLPIVLTGNLFLGQFLAVLSLPVITYLFAPKFLIISILVAVPILIKQWPRVIPMLKGKEPKWYWSKDKKKN